MTTLVTGPDGFVGQQVCRSLSQCGHSVRGAQWQAVPLSDGCESVVVGDIGAETEWDAALQGIDGIVHLAARVHIMDDDASDPLAEFRKVNVAGTRQLAVSAAEAGVRRLVFLSSIKVNGEGGLDQDAGSASYTEADEPDPQDPYGVSKWEAEQVLREVEARSGLEVVILRPPLVYGPGVKANFLRLIQLVDKGVPLPLGSIRNARSLIGLTNLADLVCQCLEQPTAAGETFVVSDGDDVSTAELVERIARALGRRPRLLPVPEAIMEFAGKLTGKSEQVQRLCSSLCIDSARVREVLTWMPPCAMEQELERVAQWWHGRTR